MIAFSAREAAESSHESSRHMTCRRNNLHSATVWEREALFVRCSPGIRREMSFGPCGRRVPAAVGHRARHNDEKAERCESGQEDGRQKAEHIRVRVEAAQQEDNAQKQQAEGEALDEILGTAPAVGTP